MDPKKIDLSNIMKFATNDDAHPRLEHVHVSSTHMVNGVPLTERQYEILKNYKPLSDPRPMTREEIRQKYGRK